MGRNKSKRPKQRLTIGQRICCCCYPSYCTTMSEARSGTDDDLDDRLECISPAPSAHSDRSPSPPPSSKHSTTSTGASNVPAPKSALKKIPKTPHLPIASATNTNDDTDTDDFANLNDQYRYDTPIEWKSYNSPGSLTSRLSSSRRETAASSITGSSLSSSATGATHASTTSVRAPGESDTLPAEVPCGLINMGNTCYMNATLQSLYSIESIRNQLLSSGSSGSGGGDKVLTRQLCNLFKQMNHKSSGSGSGSTSSYDSGTYGSAGSAVSPADFKFEFSRYQSKFCGFGQQDAQEFLRYLINGVHEESNLATKRTHRRTGASSGGSGPRTSQEAWSQYRDIVDDSPLVDLLVGQLCSTITCGQCQNKSHCWDPFWDLSLPLPMSARGSYGTTFSIRDVINEFTAAETLDSDERPSCAKCNKTTRSTKQISLARLPPVLILHLKKFTNDGYKLTNPDISIDKQLTFNGVNYKLKACISHHGLSSSSGHYTSLCEYSTRWYHFDDARVRDVTSTFDSTKLRDAYVLLYTKSGSGGSTTTTSRPTTPTTAAGAARRPSSSIVSHSKL